MISKIKKDIFERSKLKNNIGYFPQTGYSMQEHSYRYCTCDLPGLESYYFVVSKYIKFQGSSIVDIGYNVYVYDKDGNYIDDPKVTRLCKGNFFQCLKDIE